MQNSMKRPVLIFGVLSGVLIIIYTYALLKVFGDFPNVQPKDLEMMGWLGYLRYLVLLLGITMAMITYRKGTPGPIGFGRAFMVGLLSSLVVAVFVGAMEYSYIAFTNPDFYKQYANLMVEAARQSGATAQEIEEVRRQQQSFAWVTNPVLTGLFYFGETTVIGTIFSLIAAPFARRKDPPAALQGDEPAPQSA